LIYLKPTRVRRHLDPVRAGNGRLYSDLTQIISVCGEMRSLLSGR